MAMRAINELVSPFSYFSAKHANEIAVQLDGIDYVKREKQQADPSEIKEKHVDLKRHVSARGRRWLRKQVQNREGENGIKHKENANSDKTRTKYAPTKISEQ